MPDEILRIITQVENDDKIRNLRENIDKTTLSVANLAKQIEQARVTGMSPAAYVTQQRQEAAHLLNLTSQLKAAGPTASQAALGIRQMAFAMDDFANSYRFGGLAMALPSIANNIQMMAVNLGLGTKAMMAFTTASMALSLGPSAFKWLKDALDASSKLPVNLEEIKKRLEDLGKVKIKSMAEMLEVENLKARAGAMEGGGKLGGQTAYEKKYSSEALATMQGGARKTLMQEAARLNAEGLKMTADGTPRDPKLASLYAKMAKEKLSARTITVDGETVVRPEGFVQGQIDGITAKYQPLIEQAKRDLEVRSRATAFGADVTDIETATGPQLASAIERVAETVARGGNSEEAARLRGNARDLRVGQRRRQFETAQARQGISSLVQGVGSKLVNLAGEARLREEKLKKEQGFDAVAAETQQEIITAGETKLRDAVGATYGQFRELMLRKKGNVTIADAAALIATQGVDAQWARYALGLYQERFRNEQTQMRGQAPAGADPAQWANEQLARDIASDAQNAKLAQAPGPVFAKQQRNKADATVAGWRGEMASPIDRAMAMPSQEELQMRMLDQRLGGGGADPRALQGAIAQRLVATGATNDDAQYQAAEAVVSAAATLQSELLKTQGENATLNEGFMRMIQGMQQSMMMYRQRNGMMMGLMNGWQMNNFNPGFQIAPMGR
jgi:hypothetical protein